MRKFFAIPIMAAMVIGCQGGSTGYTIKGSLPEAEDSTKVYLAYMKDGEMRVDSTYAIGGKFQFTGNIDGVETANLALAMNEWQNYPPSPNNLNFYLEPGTLTVSSAEYLASAKVSGTMTNDDKNKWSEVVAPVKEKQSELSQKARAIPQNEWTPEKSEEFNVEFMRLMETEKNMALDFINANPDSFFALDKVYPIMVQSGAEIDELQDILNIFSAKVRQSNSAKEKQGYIDRVKATSIGQIAPDFSQPDPDGNTINLSDFRGQYVLLDFWASWCGPCRAENPHVVAAYNQYKDKGFTVYGVSLDNNRERWLKAIEDDNLTWTHASELNGWQNAGSTLYAVRGIPANYLLGPDGTILEKNLRGDALAEALEKYLGSEE